MKKLLLPIMLSSAALIVHPATASLAVETSSAVEASSRKPQHFVDQSNHSASNCVIGSQQLSELAPKRILSLAGGGIRGVYEAVLLSIMEELLNRGNHGPWKRVADMFDVIGGTSTGSLLAAGLAYKSPIEEVEPYKAIELLQLYVRYGFKIFDDQARLDQGAYRAKYGNEGLNDLLSIFFGDDTSFKDVSKPLYVVAHLKDDKKALVHSTRNKASVSISGSNYLLKKACGESTAAPYYFPGRIMTINGRKYAVEDGGIVANQPLEEIYNRELMLDQASGRSYAYELFAFGTGDAKPSDLIQDRVSEVTLDRGAASGIDILGGVFAGQVNGVIERMTTEVKKHSSQAIFFAHINPKVDKDYMDDTSPEYTQYMVQKVFDLVGDSSKDKNSALALMFQRLNLELPAGDELDALLGNLKMKIYQISLDTYDSILGKKLRLEANPARVELEKTWMKRICADCAGNGVKASALDFLNNIHPEGNQGFGNEDRKSFLAKVQDPERSTWVNEHYSSNDRIADPKADEFLDDVDWIGKVKAWDESNALLAVALVQEFNDLCKVTTDKNFVMNYLFHRLRSADDALAKTDNRDRKQILDNLTLLGSSIKQEGYAFCQDNKQIPGWGEWGYSYIKSATSNPGTTIASTGSLLLGATPAGLAVGAGTLIYKSKDIASAVNAHWKGDKAAPEGTPSYELHVGYQAYVNFLKAKYGL